MAEAGAMSRVAFTSLKMRPSIATNEIVTSVLPDAPAGVAIFSRGSPDSGMAQAPAAMAWPSDNVAVFGRPRIRRNVCLGMASAGPIWIGNGVSMAGSARITEATLMIGLADWVCALTGSLVTG